MDSEYYEDLIRENENVHEFDKEMFEFFEIIPHTKKFDDDDKTCRCDDFTCCFFSRPPKGYVESRPDFFYIDFNDNSRFKMNKNWVRVYKINDEEVVMHACPLLDEKGYCSEYKNRPRICKEFGSKYECNLKNATLLYERKNGIRTQTKTSPKVEASFI